jgi:hypothetical protein
MPVRFCASSVRGFLLEEGDGSFKKQSIFLDMLTTLLGGFLL